MKKPAKRFIAKSGRLDPVKSEILTKWKAGESVRSMAIGLSTRGIETSPQNLQAWINRRIKRREFPSRQGSGKGRPSRRKELFRLFGASPQSSVHATTFFTMLFGAMDCKGNFIMLSAAMEELGISAMPGDSHCPDFISFAKQLGKRRVLEMSELDFFALAAIFNRWRNFTQMNTEWVCAVAVAATELRKTMLNAVEKIK